MGIFRGQGATEYLVLLAVVLIVALVSVALLGFFPGMASDARIAQSQAYWKGQARPFAILDAKVTTSIATLTVQNMEATGPYNMTNLSIGGLGTGNTSIGTFAAGETKTFSIVAPATPCTAGAIYDYNVTISYTAPSGIAGKHYSTKNLIGKCTT